MCAGGLLVASFSSSTPRLHQLVAGKTLEQQRKEPSGPLVHHIGITQVRLAHCVGAPVERQDQGTSVDL